MLRLLLIRSKMTHNIPSADLSSMRKPYHSESVVLNEGDWHTKNPLSLFNEWFEEVKNCQRIVEPNAVCLATADKSGQPSARMVLLKSYGPEGFTFFTNFGSRKGWDLTENPNAALLFYWDVLHRQVRVEGAVERVSDQEADAYFASRPHGSKLAAALSKQSDVVEARAVLEERFKNLEKIYPNEVPRPAVWGGFRVIPKNFEFWQGQSNRLHDRIRFRRLADSEAVDNKLIKPAADGWVYERLQP